jgi:hypothetical protein
MTHLESKIAETSPPDLEPRVAARESDLQGFLTCHRHDMHADQSINASISP